MLKSKIRAWRDKLHAWGIHVGTVHGRRRFRSGVQLNYDWDERLQPCYITTVDSFGPAVRFLIPNANDHVSSFLLSGHFYAEEELRIMQQHYTQGTFVDVGANVGNHSLFAAMVLGAPVIAIEPDPDAYRLLRCNAALNECMIEHLPYGLSDRSGFARMERPDSTLGHTRLHPGSGETQVRTGDELLEGKDIGFIKIDVEGLEIEVLRGLTKTVARCQPPILIEVEDEFIPALHEICSVWDYGVRWTAKPYSPNTYFLIGPKGARC